MTSSAERYKSQRRILPSAIAHMNDRAIVKREIRSFSYSYNSMNICYHAGMYKQYAVHSGAYLHGADFFREVITRSYSKIV